MDAPTIDLDAYLDRIGYAGERTPTLRTLEGLVFGHATNIPFENLNPYFGWPVRLDLPSLEAKLVAGGRGGYCFEHNHLFRAALDAIGFSTAGLAARVVSRLQPGDPLPARTHMVVRVDLGGDTYLADVGFGSTTPTAPLRLVIGEPQSTPHARYRLVVAGDASGDLLQEVELEGAWRPMLRFDLTEQQPADYEVMNHFTATHPSSHFTTSLGAARATPDGRWTLSDRQLSFYTLDGTVKRRDLDSPAELRDVLEHEFLLRVPEDADLDRVFASPG